MPLSHTIMCDQIPSITDPDYLLLPKQQLQTADAQQVAEQILKRKLNRVELLLLPRHYEPSCACETWDITMENAIYSVLVYDLHQ